MCKYVLCILYYTGLSQQGCKKEGLIQFLEKVSRGPGECLTHYFVPRQNDLILEKENNSH